MVKAVSKEVRLAFASGATKAELIQRVQSRITKPLRFKSFRKRAETIVRTEVNRVHNAAAQTRREQLGAENVIVRKQWLASGKGRPRERTNHAEMNGQVVDVDKPFRMEGVKGTVLRPMYPLDPMLPPEESINCGCTVVEVFEVLEEETAEIAAEVVA
ncbi:MAG: phage head morphogenesis protein [Planctomycetota bacterium]